MPLSATIFTIFLNISKINITSIFYCIIEFKLANTHSLIRYRALSIHLGIRIISFKGIRTQKSPLPPPLLYCNPHPSPTISKNDPTPKVPWKVSVPIRYVTRIIITKIIKNIYNINLYVLGRYTYNSYMNVYKHVDIPCTYVYQMCK